MPSRRLLVAALASLVFTLQQPLESNQVLITLTFPKSKHIYQSITRTESITDSNLTPIWCQICRGLQFPFSIPLASVVPDGINQTLLRRLRGSEVVFDPVGLLPHDDSKRSAQIQPASTLQTTNLY